MATAGGVARRDAATGPQPATGRGSEDAHAFRATFAVLFDAHHPRLFRILDRLSGDPELAADLAQDAFVRLFRRGASPDDPEAWLISVAMNLFRNARTTAARRRRLLTVLRGRGAHGDSPPSPAAAAQASEERARVRLALDALPERERDLLVLRAEGYSYRSIAVALDLHEASVGTLLARAKKALQSRLREAGDASG